MDLTPCTCAVDALSAAPDHGLPALDHYCRVAHGFLFASARLPPTLTQRPAAVLLLAVSPGARFHVGVAGGPMAPVGAVAVRPMVARRLHALGVAVASLNLHPTHARFLHWQALPADGMLPLPRQAFAGHDAGLAQLMRGLPDQATGQALCDALLASVSALLPPAPPEHALRQRLLAWLAEDPDQPLALLAQRLGVSYHRMSHLFGQAMGLTYRQWRAYARAQRAAAHFKTPVSLTGIAHEAGFSDSAHLSHTWRRTYGLSPSFVRSDNSVQAIL